ncbi:AI-2E family transporter [Pseudooceanicola sp. MF1-13]|uniref:AI-2E family transporter n=1 Tax=Pseudooceanicola sp. MF1-13 TaxID=3379095 RepID=UPI0038916A2F
MTTPNSAEPSSETPPTTPRPVAPEGDSAVLRRIEHILAGLLVLFFLWSISLAKVVILPIVLGFLIALTLSPLVRWLGKRGIPASLSAIVIVTTIGLSSSLGVYALSGPAGRLVESLPEVRGEVERKLSTVSQKWAKVREAEEQMQEMADGEQENEPGVPDVTRVLVEEPSMIETALASLAGTGSTLLIALVLSMFLLASGDMFQTKLVQSFARFGDKKRALKISHDIERQISRYLGAITVINACLGVSIGLTLHALGMPYAYVWGAAAFLLNYLPYLGAMIGVVAVAAVSLITFETYGAMLAPPIAYLILTSLEGQIVTPLMVGRHLSLNAAAVFVAVIFWAWLWGVAGALMAVPFLVFVKVVCDSLPRLNFIGVFLGGRDQTEEDIAA